MNVLDPERLTGIESEQNIAARVHGELMDFIHDDPGDPPDYDPRDDDPYDRPRHPHSRPRVRVEA